MSTSYECLSTSSSHGDSRDDGIDDSNEGYDSYKVDGDGDKDRGSSYDASVQSPLASWRDLRSNRLNKYNNNSKKASNSLDSVFDDGDIEFSTFDPTPTTSDGSEEDAPVLRTPSTSSGASNATILSMLLGWTAMILAIFSGAASGPMFKWMMNSGLSPLLAASWRCQCMSVFLIPLAIIEAVKTGKVIEFTESKPDLEYKVWVHVLFAGVGWSMTLLFWMNGLHYITTVRASLIVNMHPLFLVIVLYMTGHKVGLLDLVGVLTAIAGVALINIVDLLGLGGDSEGGKHYSQGQQLFGAFLCLIAASGECLVIINRKKIKKYVPLMQYTAVTTAFVCVVAMIYSLIFENSVWYGLSQRSLWGWCGQKWAMPILLFGLINGVICQAGFNFAMQYIDPLVFSSALLLTPPVTGLLSWFVGLEGVPDKFTWFGGFVILLGIALITYSEHHRNTEKEAANIKLNNSCNDDSNAQLVNSSLPMKHTFTVDEEDI